MINFRIRSERLQARVLALRARVALFRAAWLSLLPVLSLVLFTIIAPDSQSRVWPWLAAGVAVFLAAAGLGRRRRDESNVIRDLDRRLGLGELLVTAAEVDQRGAKTALERRLLEDGASAIARFGGESAISDRPVRIEREALIGVCLILFGTLAVREALRLPPDPDRLPPIALPSSAGGSGPGAGAGNAGEGPGEGQGRSPGGRTPGLSPLAGAFASSAASASAAAALNDGDARGAARALRALADRADELSPGGRRTLGEALAGAADKVDDTDSELAYAARHAAEALQDENASASEGLSELAAALDAIAGRGLQTNPTPSVRERGGPALDRLADAGGEAAENLSAGDAAGGVERSAAGRGQADAAGRNLDRMGSRTGTPGSVTGDGGAAGFGAGIAPELRPIVLRYFAADGPRAP